ncbi:hypothetical protein ABPG75_008760 [Micractinium tetrahymenae]
MCPPCAHEAATGGSGQEKALRASEPAAVLQGCPPPTDCPAAEPAQQCRECPACPAAAECPPAAAEQQTGVPLLLKGEQQGLAGPGSSAAAPGPEQHPAGGSMELVCGGAEAVPLVVDSLDAAIAAIIVGVDEAFAPWADKGFTLEDLLATADALGAWGTHDCAVYNGTVTFPRRFNNECKWFCNEWVRPLRDTWERGIREGTLRVPEGVPFIWNVFDHPLCQPGTTMCPAPLLSIIKNPAMSDVLVPPFGRKGIPWCSVHPLGGTEFKPGSNCSRESLSILSGEHPGLLNVSINRPYGQAPGKEGPAATHLEHARYKYLLQLDGITASRRFATLLSMNSLVLKQESQHLEWYYHALQPCVHYLPIWQSSEEDVLGLLRTLRGNPANDLIAQRIAANANAFAATWLDDDGQLRYWQLVIDRYLQLYRGSTNETTLKTKRLVESWGQQASKTGSEVEAECWQNQGGACWMIGRDAAVAKYKELKEAAENPGKQQKKAGGKKGKAAGKEAGGAGGAEGGGDAAGGEGGGGQAANGVAPLSLLLPSVQPGGDSGQAAEGQAAASAADPAGQAAVEQAPAKEAAADAATAAEGVARRALRAYMEAEMGDDEA